MIPPDVRQTYEYARERYPAIAKQIAELDAMVAQHQMAIMDVLRQRAYILQELHRGKALETYDDGRMVIRWQGDTYPLKRTAS